EPLVEVTRGSLVESVHRGHLAVVDGRGRRLAHLGSPGTVTYLRSSSKPQQAIPLVISGAADRFRLTAEELALACGSHNGEPEHTETVSQMLEKLGLDESALRCGSHEPYGEKEQRRLQALDQKPGPLHNNCSGKHAGMLALALHLGAPAEGYTDLYHPVQQAILGIIATFSDVPEEEIAIGTDGCGVPTFGVPVEAMALMFARLVSPPPSWDSSLVAACGRIVEAMVQYPEMVEGEGEMDTEIMRAARGRIVSKVGAEGVYTAGIRPSETYPHGLGIAFKIEDGDGKERARPPAAIEVLRQLGLLGEEELGKLERFDASTLSNHRGDEVGRVRPAFSLEKLDRQQP
ncbi:MAG TPA: asparaginase, partial [Rubrobacteraceae bacterium]